MSASIPLGCCQCGCGQATTIAKKTQASQGAVAGVPSRYRRGHQNRNNDPLERFWAKVDRCGPDECWPWLAHVAANGYGTFRIRGRFMSAHRAAYTLLVGPIPAGMTIDHVRARGCTRRDCVNPAHLEVVTIQENLRRRDAERRAA